MARKNGSVGELAIDIDRAAYLHLAEGWSIDKLSIEFKRSKRTIFRWKQSLIWKRREALMEQEG